MSYSGSEKDYQGAKVPQRSLHTDNQPRTQARGRARRQLLVQKAKELLDEEPLQSISLADIAKAAGIPKGSAYHFYPGVAEVFRGVADQFAEDFVAAISAPYELADDSGWLDIYNEAADRVLTIYADNPSYRQLIVGGKASTEIKRADRANDEYVGELLVAAINQHFELPAIPRLAEIFFYSVEIVDLFLMLSMLRHDRITEEMANEGKVAARAFLREYLPGTVARRVAPSDERTVTMLARVNRHPE